MGQNVNENKAMTKVVIAIITGAMYALIYVRYVPICLQIKGLGN